jgi:hypothetical protein
MARGGNGSGLTGNIHYTYLILAKAYNTRRRVEGKDEKGHTKRGRK